MEKLLGNVGLQHLAIHIFEYLDNYSLTQCMLVWKDWDDFLERIILVRRFDDLLKLKYTRLVEYDDYEHLSLSLDWHEAARYFRQQCTVKDLKEVVSVLQEWFYKSHAVYCPLEYAARKGHEGFFRTILNTSIDLNRWHDSEWLWENVQFYDEDSDGTIKPPIFNACIYGQIKIVKLLLDVKESGANIEVISSAGILPRKLKGHLKNYSILYEAVKNSNPELTEFLLQRSKNIGLDINDNLGWESQAFTILHVACQLKDQAPEMVKLILDHAKMNNIKINVFPCFLHKVVPAIRDLNVLKLLLDRYEDIGLDLNERDSCPNGRTVVAVACTLVIVKPEKLRILLDFAYQRGIDVNVPDLFGTDILQYAATFGNPEILREILQNDFQLDFDLLRKNEEGDSALFSALMRNPRNVSLLLDFAIEKKMQLPIYGYSNLNQSILQAKMYDLEDLKDLEAVKAIIARRLEIGLDINHRDENGMTALDLLMEDDRYSLNPIKIEVKELLENAGGKCKLSTSLSDLLCTRFKM